VVSNQWLSCDFPMMGNWLPATGYVPRGAILDVMV
jgi:hypothetical protein